MNRFITCAILAGGLSQRMGKDKATLDFGDGCLIEGIYRRARKVFDNVLIVSSHHRSFIGVDAPVVDDVLPVKGSMVGIVSALMHAETSNVFVLACDMPFVSEGSMRADLRLLYVEPYTAWQIKDQQPVCLSDRESRRRPSSLFH
jgi:molybdopterin-guanine dinucleotide biosynthesis protein A